MIIGVFVWCVSFFIMVFVVKVGKVFCVMECLIVGFLGLWSFRCVWFVWWFLMFMVCCLMCILWLCVLSNCLLVRVRCCWCFGVISRLIICVFVCWLVFWVNIISCFGILLLMCCVMLWYVWVLSFLFMMRLCWCVNMCVCLCFLRMCLCCVVCVRWVCCWVFFLMVIFRCLILLWRVWGCLGCLIMCCWLMWLSFIRLCFKFMCWCYKCLVCWWNRFCLFCLMVGMFVVWCGMVL